MSTLTTAVLSFGLIVPSGSFPDPYDVRVGVDNGNGDLGTLTSPAEADVRLDVGYGGDGDQYEGLLLAPGQASGVVSTDAWLLLYQAQTGWLGLEIVATVDGFCTNRPAIISSVALDEIFLDGPRGQAGGWDIQIRISDLSSEPPKNTPISCNGEASGLPLRVLSVDRTGGIFKITAVDFSAKNR